MRNLYLFRHPWLVPHSFVYPKIFHFNKFKPTALTHLIITFKQHEYFDFELK